MVQHGWVTPNTRTISGLYLENVFAWGKARIVSIGFGCHWLPLILHAFQRVSVSHGPLIAQAYTSEFDPYITLGMREVNAIYGIPFHQIHL